MTKRATGGALPVPVLGHDGGGFVMVSEKVPILRQISGNDDDKVQVKGVSGVTRGGGVERVEGERLQEEGSSWWWWWCVCRLVLRSWRAEPNNFGALFVRCSAGAQLAGGLGGCWVLPTFARRAGAGPPLRQRRLNFSGSADSTSIDPRQLPDDDITPSSHRCPTTRRPLLLHIFPPIPELPLVHRSHVCPLRGVQGSIDPVTPRRAGSGR